MNKPIAKEEFDAVQAAELTPDVSADEDERRKQRRKRGFMGLALVLVLSALGWFGYGWIAGDGMIETDNAYVGAETAQVTPLVAGQVAEVRVSDAQEVRAGDILVVLDQTDARIAVAEAQAALEQARRRVAGMVATDRQLAAQISGRDAEARAASARIAAAQSELQKTLQEYSRRAALAASGAVSAEEVGTARAEMDQARSALQAAQAAAAQAAAARSAASGQRDANLAMIRGTSIGDHPDVAAARAQLDRARLELERTVIRAPVAGIVAQRRVQIGQRVQPGAPLMSVVPIHEAYVDANFKEGELTEVRVGQPVELYADLYGEEVIFHGEVVGLAGGTGSAFALIPAQNATGNWIKVVQRVPVRIRLRPEELRQHPLRVGLSMTARVRVET